MNETSRTRVRRMAGAADHVCGHCRHPFTLVAVDPGRGPKGRDTHIYRCTSPDCVRRAWAVPRVVVSVPEDDEP